MTDGEHIRVLKGLEGVRRRPWMFIGGNSDGGATAEALVDTMVRWLVEGLAANDPSRACVRTPPFALRLGLWGDGVASLHLDGVALRLDDADVPGAWPAPHLYGAFLHLLAGAPLVEAALPFLNALSSMLEVTTRHGAQAYRARFATGGLISLLDEVGTADLAGDTVLTFRPDADVVPGELTAETCRAICDARTCAAVPVTFVDHRPARAVSW